MRKILLSILSGLLAVAVFSRIAIRYFDFLPMPWIWGLTALLTIIIIIKPSKQWICFAISFDLIVFGWQKLFHQQANVPQSVLDMPFSSLPADTVNWAYFQYSYPYMVAIALTQIICSFLLLFRKTRLLGLIMLLPVLLNIMMIDVFYQIGVGALLHATILFAGVIYLLTGYYNQLKQVFFQKNECNIYIVLAAAVLPFLLVATAPSTDKNPSITGKYKVENHALTIVYLEHFNDVTLQWGDVNHRYTGKYQYRGDTLIAGPLQGIIKKKMDHLTITGTLEKDSVHLDMIRL